MALAILPIMNSTSVELLTKSVIQPLWASIISSGKQEQASPRWGSASGSAPRKPPPPLPMLTECCSPLQRQGVSVIRSRRRRAALHLRNAEQGPRLRMCQAHCAMETDASPSQKAWYWTSQSAMQYKFFRF